MLHDSGPGAGWIFRPGLQRGFREIARLSGSIAFGFCDLGDLAALPPRRTAFRKVVTELYPDLPPSQFPVMISQFHWFACAMQPGDLVALVEERLSMVCLGRVSGPYVYSPTEAPCINQREVIWTRPVPLYSTPLPCREHWRARTGLFPMGKVLPLISALEGDALIQMDSD